MKSKMQSLESSVDSLILETVLKLASLTETSFFLLIENEEGRKFCGKKHLTDAYLDGTLTPIGNDTQMELNSDAITLKESYQYFYQPIMEVTRPDLRKNLKREWQEDHSISENNKRQSNDFNNWTVEEDLEEAEVETISDEVELINMGQPGTTIGIGDGGAFDFDSLLIDVTSLTTKDQESIEELKNIDNVIGVFQKGTIENKLFSKVFYEFGKELASQYTFSSKKCFRDGMFKSYFLTNCDAFCRLFPNLDASSGNLKDLRISVGSKKYSVKTYMREKIRYGLKHRIRHGHKKLKCDDLDFQ